MKKIIKQSAFFLVFIIPMLILKIRTGISFEKCKTITRFYLYAAIYHKQYIKAIKVFFLLFFKISWKNFYPDASLFGSKYKTKEPLWEIGAWYSIKPEKLNETEEIADTENMKYFSIGRESIAHVLKINHFDKKVALLPNFTCFTVLDPFIQDEWEIHFYSYNKNLSVNIDGFIEAFEKVNPSICVFQPLSGMGFLEAEKKLIEYAHKNKCMTVVDQTQDIYNDRSNQFVDYYCASLRKWYPFPDGAFLYSENHIIDKCESSL